MQVDRCRELRRSKYAMSRFGASCGGVLPACRRKNKQNIAQPEGKKAAVQSLEQITNEMSELLCKDLPVNPCREIGVSGLCSL